MIIGKDRIKPDPDKIKCPKEASKPHSKADAMSFLCFKQSFVDFIPHLSRKYPQIDLEAMTVDFSVTRFRHYIVGGPQVEMITDHKPMISIFANSKKALSQLSD